MYLTWKRNEQGVYEGCTKTFNDVTGKHEPIFNIERHGLNSKRHPLWSVRQYGKVVSGTPFFKLAQAKRFAQELEDKNPPRLTEADEAERLAWSHGAGELISCYITAERIGGPSYVSEDGKAIISETRYPDGHIETERREYSRT